MRARAGAALLVMSLAACGGGTTAQPNPNPTASDTATRQPSPSRGAVAATNASSSWPTYHKNGARTGDAGATVPALTTLRTAWSVRLDGAVYGSPIVVGSTAVVATENDTVYALNLTNGSAVWRRHLGTPVPLSQLPCGNINPLGITGTPAYDPVTGSVFAVAETTGGVHTLYALAASTGVVRWRRNLDVLSNRSRIAEQQRAAVLLAGSRVVVAFGGLAGDCSNYVGYVTSVPTSGSGSTTVFAVPTAREGGIWAAAGPMYADSLVYVATGNGASTGGRYDGSDSVVSLNPTTMRRVALFAPSTWAADNAADADLGSMSPAAVAGRIISAGKRGNVYLLRSTLGGIGTQLATLSGCKAFGGAAVRGSIAYLPCTTGLRALRVGSTSLAWSWQAAGIPGSAVLAGGVAYDLAPARSTLYEISLSTGKVLRSISVGTVTRFASPTVASGGHLVLVPTTHGVVAIG